MVKYTAHNSTYRGSNPFVPIIRFYSSRVEHGTVNIAIDVRIILEARKPKCWNR